MHVNEAVTVSEVIPIILSAISLLPQIFSTMSFLRSLARSQEMSRIGRRGIHSMPKLCADKISRVLLDTAQDRVIKAALTIVRENARLKKELVRNLGGAVATSTLLGVPLGHNPSFREGQALSPPFIREAIWSASSNYTTEEGKDLQDLRVLTDVGDVPVQELRDCGIEDEKLMEVISESVKQVMEEHPLRPLVLGGDQSISYPVVKAISENLGGQVDILHFDSHPDLNAFEGNIYSHDSSFARITEGGYVRRLLQVGIRSITKEGRDQAKKFRGVELHEMRAFAKDRSRLGNLKLGEGVKGVYISIDVGCLDPAFAQGVSNIESGGLSPRDVLNILQNLKGDVVGGDVVEYNTQRDTNDAMTAKVAAKFVRELAARMSK